MILQLESTDSDMSYNFDGNTFDQFRIYGEDGTALFDLRLQWVGENERDAVATLTCLTEVDAAALPFVMNSFHFIGMVNDCLIDLLNTHGDGDTEFFCDCFHDAEGNKIRQPFELKATRLP